MPLHLLCKCNMRLHLLFVATTVLCALSSPVVVAAFLPSSSVWLSSSPSSMSSSSSGDRLEGAARVTTRLFLTKEEWLAVIKQYAEEGTLDKAADTFAKVQEKWEKDKENLNQDKENLNKDKESLNRSLLKSEEALVRLQARYSAETNLRPIVETFAAKEWSKICRGQQPTPGVQKMLNVYLQENRAKVDGCIDRALELSARFGKRYDIRKSSIRAEMETLYERLSSEIHDVKLPSGCPVGFVVNEDPTSSLAASALLMCSGDPHTVMTNDYLDLVYKWDPLDEVSSDEEVSSEEV